MLGNIFNYLVWFKDTVVSLFTFFVTILKDFISLLAVVPGVLSVITSSIAYLPDIVSAFAILTIVISVTYLLVGRSQGG